MLNSYILLVLLHLLHLSKLIKYQITFYNVCVWVSTLALTYIKKQQLSALAQNSRIGVSLLSNINTATTWFIRSSQGAGRAAEQIITQQYARNVALRVPDSSAEPRLRNDACVCA